MKTSISQILSALCFAAGIICSVSAFFTADVIMNRLLVGLGVIACLLSVRFLARQTVVQKTEPAPATQPLKTQRTLWPTSPEIQKPKTKKHEYEYA